MSGPSPDQIKEALSAVKYPGFSRDIVSFGLVREVSVRDGKAVIQLDITTTDATVPGQIKKEVEAVVAGLSGLTSAEVKVAVTKPKAVPPPSAPSTVPVQDQLSGVEKIIAVASGKGGVGKSTFSVNLACALQLLQEEMDPPGKPVGIMDCDIYGPSVPLMMGLGDQPEIDGELIVPLENYGIKVMSMGLLVDEESPVVWRGPMVMKTIQQFASNVKWGEVSTLVVDLPPGTGDAQLSLVQTLPLAGALVVTTPQKAAANVARRGARMFGKVNVPILGVAENMSYMELSDGERQYLFGSGGGEETASALDAPLLGQVPLAEAIRQGSDMGIPIVLGQPESEPAKVFMGIAKKLLEALRG
jgi:ATP-binding protein involved in chromosome partitioning